MDELTPGPDGSPLPAGEWVLRLCERSSLVIETKKPHPKNFALRDVEKAMAVPRLSVFAEKLTTPNEAWSLGIKNPRYSVAFRMCCDKVRAIRPDPESSEMPMVDVQWEQAKVQGENGEWVPDTRPGAVGHAGITQLGRDDILKSAQRKSIRSQLADCSEFVVDLAPDT